MIMEKGYVQFEHILCDKACGNCEECRRALRNTGVQTLEELKREIEDTQYFRASVGYNHSRRYSKLEMSFALTEIERLAKERDAAILDMELIAEGNLCFYCKHGPASCEKSYSLHACGSFEWRGLQEEEEKTT
jgi:hypothetical protein